jgi:rubrerythrin
MAGSVSSIETERNPSYENNKQKHFLICESCFWCASLLSSNPHHGLSKDETIPKCPLCDSDRIGVIPIFLKGLQV